MDNIYSILAKVCSFFRSDGIIFMPNFGDSKHLAVPTFDKYALMVDDKVNFKYSYVSIDISKINQLSIGDFPRFYNKENFLKATQWTNTNQLLEDTCRLIDKVLRDRNVKILARDMTSAIKLDIEIWREASSIDELVVQIDLGLKFKRSRKKM